MWLFTKNGFYSACRNKDDETKVHVRAQLRGDLEHLREVTYPYSPTEVVETPFGDYRFRLDISTEGWEYFLKRESDAIDYIKFKPAVKDHSFNRKESYLSCFFAMMQAGKNEEMDELNRRK